MKTLFKLAILFLIAHALFRLDLPYWHHNQFESALSELSQQWGEPTDEEVMEHVLATAARHNVPITREHVTVRRVREHILVDLAYAVPIEWLPTMKKPWEFEYHLDAWKVGQPTPRR